MSKRQSLSSYKRWLESQVRLFRSCRKAQPCRLLEIMKDIRYDLVPLHKRPDLLRQCCKLLNSEWKRSETARLRSLNVSCDKYPTCLLLLSSKDAVVGHCKVSRINNTTDSVIIESFIIDHAYRYQGIGSMLLRAVEDYVFKSGIKNVYLMTKGQEGFYLKNGYAICQPIEQLDGYTDFGSDSHPIDENDKNSEKKEIISAGPPPPPMPTDLKKPSLQICLTIAKRTFMKKKLEL